MLYRNGGLPEAHQKFKRQSSESAATPRMVEDVRWTWKEGTRRLHGPLAIERANCLEQ